VKVYNKKITLNDKIITLST